MDQIAYPPVRRAMRKLKALSADDETRRLAEVRERALMTERTEINAALMRGKQEGANEANAKAIQSLIKSGMTEAQAKNLLGLA